MLTRRIAPLLLVLAGCSPARPATQAADPGPTAWEADVQRFEAADRAAPPAPGGVVFAGSSSIRLWPSLESAFPGVRALNRGFGGTEMEDLLHYADRLVIAYRPRLVFVYEGDNDLNAGDSPEEVAAEYRQLVRRIHAALPETRVGFISIKPSPSRWHLADRVRRANELVRRFTESDPRLFYVDVFTPMLGPDGTPRPELYVADRLHMTDAGYAIWREAVAPHLRQQ